MSIRPVDFNGMIQRTQDVGNLKQNEDSRPAVQQQNIEIKQEKQEDNLAHKVQDTEEKENFSFRYDAKEKGSNSYSRDDTKKKKKQKSMEGTDGSVRPKERKCSFDIKI